MIAPAFLRIGNILSVCYEEGLKPYTVEIIQSDLVHLSGREEADDPRDLAGIPVTWNFLKQNNFEEQEHHQFFMRINSRVVTIHFINEGDSLSLFVDNIKFSLRYIHELQNILFYAAGWEMPYLLQKTLNLPSCMTEVNDQ